MMETCRKCPMGCDLCDNADTCTQVSDGWVKTNGPNGRLVKCRPGCQECDPAKAEDCKVPMAGFYIVPSKAIAKKCPTNCLECDPANPSQCRKCYKNDHKVGTNCNECNPNCLTCDSNVLTQCKSCRRGMRLNNSTFVCESAASRAG